MRLGISLPIDTGDERVGNVIARGARDAERYGFDSVWFFDSIGRGSMSIDPLIGVSVAASVTNNIEVGIGILQVPIRHPVELAQRVLSAQLLCEGRLLLGVGSGSTKGDFEAVGKSFDDRMILLRNGLSTMRQLWNGETVGGVNLAPVASVRGGPPIVVGSWAGRQWISAAANEYDGWIASAFFSGFDTLNNGIKRYRAGAGERALVTNISVDLKAPTEALSDSDNAFHLKCDPATAAERLIRLAEAGFDDAILVYRGSGPPDLGAIREILP